MAGDIAVGHQPDGALAGAGIGPQQIGSGIAAEIAMGRQAPAGGVQIGRRRGGRPVRPHQPGRGGTVGIVPPQHVGMAVIVEVAGGKLRPAAVAGRDRIGVAGAQPVDGCDLDGRAEAGAVLVPPDLVAVDTIRVGFDERGALPSTKSMPGVVARSRDPPSVILSPSKLLKSVMVSPKSDGVLVDKRVGARAAGQGVSAGTADQSVVAAGTYQIVIAGTAREQVGKLRADD